MMTTTVNATPPLASRLVNGFLAIKPLANLAKQQARKMIVKRAEKIGVPWTQQVNKLRSLDWESYLSQVQNPQLTYFTFDIEEAIAQAGFQSPMITPNSPRHRTIIAQVET